MKKILYILRHGETNENKIGIVQGQGIDSSLNELGLWQASQFFKKYKNRSFDQIIASGQKRSYQTIEAFESNHQRIHRDIRINEISWGEHEGKAGEPDLMIKYYKILDAWKSGDYSASPISGESASKLYERINEFINDIQANPYQQILVCTHGRTLRALVCRLKMLKGKTKLPWCFTVHLWVRMNASSVSLSNIMREHSLHGFRRFRWSWRQLRIVT